MECTTLSHQIDIEPGICVSIQDILRHQRTLRRDDFNLRDELSKTKDLGPYNPFLWKPYKPKVDELFLKVQNMSSVKEIKLHEELYQEDFSEQRITKADNYVFTNQRLSEKKRSFEPYVEEPEVEI